MTTTADRAAAIASPASRVRDRAGTMPDRVALREKSRGIWREITWAEYWDRVETFAHTVQSLKLEVPAFPRKRHNGGDGVRIVRRELWA